MPEGPGLVAWEQAKLWIDDPIAFWTGCQAAYGDTFTVHLGSQGPTVLFCDPLAIQGIFALPRQAYSCSKYNEHYERILGSHSLLLLDGEAHAAERQGWQPHFVPEVIASGLGRLAALVTEHLARWCVGEVISVRRFTHAMAFEHILWFLFRDGHAELRELLRAIFLQDLTKDYGTWSPWARFTKWHGVLRPRIATEVAALRARPTERTEGFFADLAVARSSEGRPLDIDPIADQVFTLLIAGVDPTMISAAWALYWIHQTPEVRDALRAELGGACDRAEILPRASYLEATIKESLRMFPVVTTPSGRRLSRETEIAGRRYPAGCTLLPCTYLVHRRASLYERPESFWPERFERRNYRPYEYFPFGGGLRLCPGARMAVAVIRTIVAVTMRHVEWEPAWSGEVVPIRHGTLLAPSDNLHLRVVRREA